jgi:predicted nucleic acid-binding protein
VDKKLTLYLDTSVVSHLDHPDNPQNTLITQKLWDSCKKQEYIVFISELVLIELEGCNPAKKTKLYSYLRQVDYNLIFLTEEISNLAEKYINSAIIPQKYRSDALHIAAPVSNCDFLVSWNFKHIVRAKTILGVNGVNKLAGYKEIQIVSSNMLVDEE